ncbi:MAG: acyl carrier protein [Rubrivivax sp.]|jgi:acyl carrier protein|nr:acyl carrier protein [Rubrivivax sp.]
MTRDEILTHLLGALGDIAPEVDLPTLDAERRLRHQVDLDSADWLNFLVAVHQRLGVEIPDAEAARLHTLAQIADFCAAHGARPPGGA